MDHIGSSVRRSYDLVHVTVTELKPGEFVRVDGYSDDLADLLNTTLALIPSGKSIKEITRIQSYHDGMAVNEGYPLPNFVATAARCDPSLNTDRWVIFSEPVITFDLVMVSTGALHWAVEGTDVGAVFATDIPALYALARKFEPRIGAPWQYADANYEDDHAIKHDIERMLGIPHALFANTHAHNVSFWSVYRYRDSWDYWGDYDYSITLEGTLDTSKLSRAIVPLNEADCPQLTQPS